MKNIKNIMRNIMQYKNIVSVSCGRYPVKGYDYNKPTVFIKAVDGSVINIIENNAFKYLGYNGEYISPSGCVNISTPFHSTIMGAFRDSYRDVKAYFWEV